MPEIRTQFEINWMESVQYNLDRIAEEAKRKNDLLARIADSLHVISQNTMK